MKGIWESKVHFLRLPQEALLTNFKWAWLLSGFRLIFFSPSLSLVKLITTLFLHQTQTQRSTVRIEGAGPLSQGHIPTVTRPESGAPHRRRRPCCPVRGLRRRNTSTYLCCCRRQTSAPLTTPSTKVTDQTSFAVESDSVVFKALSKLVSVFAFRPSFSDCALARWALPLFPLASLQSCLLKKGEKTELKLFLWCFFIAWIANHFCSICTFWQIVWTVRFCCTTDWYPKALLKVLIWLVQKAQRCGPCVCFICLSVSVSLSSCHCTSHIF